MRKKNLDRRKSLEKKVFRKRTKRRIYLRIRNKLKQRPQSKIQSLPRNYRRRNFNRRKTIHLPAKFSFINNPTQVLKTFAEFRIYALKGINVLLDFRSVLIMTPDVIPFLLAKVSKYSRVINIHSNRPSVDIIDNMLLESGFYKTVGLTDHKSNIGLLETHKSKIVDTEVAQKARILTSTKTLGDPDMKIHALYRTLIECMANTKKHAYVNDPMQSWWLSVYHNPDNKITSFSFCDNGVGIFKSTKIEKLAKFAIKIGLTSNVSILQKILEGKIQSSTGLPYRGKGLPKIYSDYKSNSLKKLCIAANDTFADFDNGTFIDLKDELNGTFLYWEIWPN